MLLKYNVTSPIPSLKKVKISVSDYQKPKSISSLENTRLSGVSSFLFVTNQSGTKSNAKI